VLRIFGGARRHWRVGTAEYRRVAIKETLDQIAHGAPPERAVQKRSANDIRPANPGEVRNHVGRLGMTKYEPRLAFVALPAFGLKGKPKPLQRARCTIQTRQIVLGPTVTMLTHIAPGSE
jgi:hypothetical protein